MAHSVSPTLVHLISSSGFYGAERVVANLCQTLPNINTLVLCLSSGATDTRTFAQHVTRSKAVFISCPNSMSRALSALRQIHTQHPQLILHAHGYKEIVIACLYSWISGSRVIVTQHGFTERNVKSKIYNLINKAFCRWGGVDKIIAVSESIKDIYRAFSVDPLRLIVLPNGLLPQTRLNRKECRVHLASQFDIACDRPIVAYVGRLSAEKDPLLFVDAFFELKQQNPRCFGVIAGEGPLKPVLVDRIQRYQLNDDLVMLGFIEDVEHLLPAIDVLLMTSVTEGTPMTALEAMAAGTVVVSTAVGGVPDIIKHGENGLLIGDRKPRSFADCCAAMLSSPERMAQLSAAAIKTIEEHYNLFAQQSVYENDIYGLDLAS